MSKSLTNPIIKGRAKKDLEEFRGGSSDDQATPEKEPKGYEAERATKTYRVSKTHINLLAQTAYEKTMNEGRKIYEADVIEEALNNYFFGGGKDASK